MRALKVALCVLVVFSLVLPLAVYYAQLSGLTGENLVVQLKDKTSKFQRHFFQPYSSARDHPTNVTRTVPVTTLGLSELSSTSHKGNSLHFNRYMISLVYAEQLTNAFQHYNEFLSLATRWNYTGVEPFVKNSRMTGFQTLFPDDTYKIRLLFDMDTFSEQYKECVRGNRSKLIEPMDTFLQSSFRDIVVVYFSRHMFVLDRAIHKSMDASLKDKFSKHKDNAIVSCTELAAKSLIPTVKERLHREQLQNSLTKDNEFTIREVLCINPDVAMSLVEMMDHISNQTGPNASVLFVSWQGKWTRQFNDSDAMWHCIVSFSQIPFSTQVKTRASEFTASKGLKQNNYISIHARFEKVFEFAFLKRTSNQSGYYTCCMKKLELILRELSNRTAIPLNQTLFLSDYSAYGSDSCHYQGHWQPGKVCKDETAKMVSLLSVDISEFDPNGSDAEHNTGFISLVEETSLLDGRVLVTVGGGRFQATLVGRYIDHHRNSQSASDSVGLHYHICNQKETLNGLTTELPKC